MKNVEKAASKKISVIIPTYNASATIRECNDSLIAQTIFNDLELIFVDDCSKDNTADILLEYEKQYPDNICVIRLDANGGPGNARNIAMEYASGEYIGYVDADDAVYPSMYEKLLAEAESTGADIVDTGFYDQSNDTAIIFTSDDLTGRLDDQMRSRLIIAGGYIWSKIFRHKFLTENNIVFRCEYMLEDMDYLIEAFARAQVISNVKEIMYVYRSSDGSLSKNKNMYKYIHSQATAMQAIYNRVSSLENYDGIRDAAEYAMMRLYSYMLNTCMNSVYLKEQPKEAVIPVMESLKKMKDQVIHGGYANPYIVKGLSDTDMIAVRANDISAIEALRLQGD